MSHHATVDGMSTIDRRWQYVRGFDKLYCVSNDGLVRRMDKVGDGFIKSFLNRKVNGYLKVTLSKDNHCYNRLVHRMVAEAFVPNPHNLPEVLHIDHNKMNNNASNLKWGTKIFVLMNSTGKENRIKTFMAQLQNTDKLLRQ